MTRFWQFYSDVAVISGPRAGIVKNRIKVSPAQVSNVNANLLNTTPVRLGVNFFPTTGGRRDFQRPQGTKEISRSVAGRAY
jgi:hypothetical protein